MYHLEAEQREAILQRLSPAQKDFLTDHMIRGQRTAFAGELAKQKGAIVPEHASYEEIEHLIDGWIYIGYHDAGHVSNQFTCECGRSLRYRHTVRNKQTGDILHFGIDHLQLHTGIDTRTVAHIRKGFDSIDLELSEILIKLDDGWKLDRVMEPLPAGFELPKDIQEHLDMELPLLDRQISRLRALLRAYGLGQQAPTVKERRPAAQPQLPPEPVQVSLFEWDEPAAEPRAYALRSEWADDAPAGKELTIAQMSAIEQYVREGVSSARIICELLIKHHRAWDERFITEKPKIYLPVCYHMESLGCRLLSAGPNDRCYQYTND